MTVTVTVTVMLINSENKITDCNDFDHNGKYFWAFQLF